MDKQTKEKRRLEMIIGLIVLAMILVLLFALFSLEPVDEAICLNCRYHNKCKKFKNEVCNDFRFRE